MTLQLREIRLRNIRSYESARLTLGPGTTLVVGDVGSGKTSLLYAIEMALFGFAVVDPTYLVRHGAPEAEVVLLLEDGDERYEFVRRFRRRTRRGREVFEGGELAFSHNGAKTQFSTTELRRRVIELLGFPDNPNPRSHSDLWRWAVYVPQESMREVLGERPEERLQSVRKALALEEYRTAAENSGLVATELRRRVTRAEEIAQELEPWVARGASATALGIELRERLARLDIEIGILRSEVAAAEEVIRGVDALLRQSARLAAEADGLADQLRRSVDALGGLARKHAGLETALVGATQIASGAPAAELGLQEARERIAAFDRDLERLRLEREEQGADAERLARATTGRDGARERVRRAADEQAAVGAELSDARKQEEQLAREGPQHEPPAPTRRTIDEIDAETGPLRGRVDAAIAASAGARHELDSAERLLHDGICPTCHQTVRGDEFQAHRATARSASEEAERVLHEVERTLADLRDERAARERYERSLLSWTNAVARRTLAGERRVRAEGRHREAEERHVRATEQLEQAEAEVHLLAPVTERLHQLEERRILAGRERAAAAAAVETAGERVAVTRQGLDSVATLTTQRSALAEEIVSANRLHSELAQRAGSVRERRAELAPALAGEAVARQRLTDAQNRREASDRDRVRVESEQRRVDGEIAEAEEAAQRRDRILREAATQRALAEWMARAFPEGLLALEHRLLARAQAEFEHHLARFFHLLVEDPGMVARCGTSFSPFVEIEGEETPAEALSGGERTALALAFRLALGLVVRDVGRLRLGTLILDEPTDGFSPEQVTRMGDLLESLGIGQVILVSHEAQLAAAADRVIQVRKENGVSILREPGASGGDEAEPALASVEAPARAGRVRTPRLDADPVS